MSKKEHRGRIQAQSDHLEESVSWAQDTPPGLKQGLDMVEELKKKTEQKRIKKARETVRAIRALYEECI